jgi:hypothetical protein
MIRSLSLPYNNRYGTVDFSVFLTTIFVVVLGRFVAYLIVTSFKDLCCLLEGFEPFPTSSSGAGT